MDKRRYITQLPAVHQSETLKKFFGSTVDHIFQPGVADQISGYIGRRPSYHDSVKDFYISEPTDLRREHQLEPAMITTDVESGAPKHILFYDDLINYLRSARGIVTDHDRLFATQHHAWCPPVNPDKLLNFSHYCWFGDEPAAMPAVRLMAPMARIRGNGQRREFQLPPRISADFDELESVMAFVDGLPVGIASRNGDNITLDDAPPSGSNVETYRYGDLRRLIEGQETFDVSGLTAQSVTELSTGMRVIIDDGITRLESFDDTPLDSIDLPSNIGRWIVPDFDTVGFDLGYRQIPWDAHAITNDFFVNGVGESIQLTPFVSKPDLPTKTPAHVVVDRRSRDGNPWARINYWVHRDALAWTGELFVDRSAKRPIVEFLANLELWNYGTRRVGDVDLYVSGPLLKSPISHPNGVAPSPGGSDWHPETYAEIDISDINGALPGTVFLPGEHVLKFGDRILVTNHTNAALNNRIFTVRASRERIDDLVVREVMILVPEPETRKGDTIRVRQSKPIAFDTSPHSTAPWVIDTRTTEYFFNGEKWVLAQAFSVGSDPLFALYDATYTSHDVIEGSLFSGNRLFGYATGSGAIDQVLKRALERDQFGEIVFENDMVTIPTTLANGTNVVGYQFCRQVGETTGQDRYLNGWFPATVRFEQTRDASSGIWSLPASLTANPDNEQPTTISRGQWFDHFVTMLERQDGFIGKANAANNSRDLARRPDLGTRIVQHRDPLLKTMLLASDPMFDLPEAMRFVEQEYVRFRAKFVQQVIEIYHNGVLTEEDAPSRWVDQALANINRTKNDDSPFRLSSMGGGEYYIPPTPAALGLLPASAPGIVIDDTYAQPVRLLRGHDGSLTLPFGDIRDSVLLALEQRLWNAIPASLRAGKPAVDLFDVTDGRHRTGAGTVFTRDEVTAMLSPHFRRWAQNNGLEYQAFEGYEADNPFTWNYRDVADRDGIPMPGHWRAIYRWYFDTDRPHAAPWEMLGFTSMPDWWTEKYGPAPYTRGNSQLWEDLEAGRIAAGPRKGIDHRFRRPGLMDVLPVDSAGRLLDPVAAKIIPVAPTRQQATRRWLIGDHAPVENLWRMSPSFGFAKAQIAFLMRPAQFVEQGWDTVNRRLLADGQIIHSATGDRPRAANIQYVHGEIVDGVQQSVTGVQQFIVEHMISRAQSPSLFGDAVRGLGVRLAHKMAGFTSANDLRVFADNFGLVPQEDTRVVLHRSPPLREAIYGGIIVEWTGTSWRIIGYDDWERETITIIPPDTASAKRTVRLGEELVINEWRANVFYQVNTFVEYQQSIYRCLRTHTSAGIFEDEFWKAEPNVRKPQAYSVVVYERGEDRIVEIENGTEVSSIQEVVDILLSYERWLVEQGFVFDEVDLETGEVQDWMAAAREFMLWAQMDWEPGNFIALSPAASVLKFRTDHGIVYNLEDRVNGVYGLVDRTGRPIARRNTFVSRLDEETKIVTVTDDLFGARLRVGEIEHVLVFSNLTIFNDVIYQPLYDLRQPRLRLIGQRTQGWKGRLDAPGYMVDEDTLLPNFDRSAEDLRDMFNIEHADRRILRDHARHLVGYQKRSYLDNLLISETQQFEFFQGMIQQKGAPGVFEKLVRSDFVEQQRDLRFLEEWAIQAGRYGAVGTRREAAFVLRRDDIRNNPQFVSFSPNLTISGGVQVDDARWIDRPKGNVFTQLAVTAQDGTLPEHGALPTAGPVRVDEIDYTVFNDNQLSLLYSTLQTEGRSIVEGERVWVYDLALSGWNVLRATSVGNSLPNNVVYRIDTDTEDETLNPLVIRVYFTNEVDLTESDIGRYFALVGDTGTTPDLQGFFKIVGFFAGCGGEGCDYFVDLDASTRIPASATVKGYDFTADIADPASKVVPPSALVFRPMRFATPTALNSFQSQHPLPTGEIAYVDAVSDGSSQVLYRTESGWRVHRTLPQKVDSARIASTLIYDLNTKITDRSLSPEPLMLDRLNVIDPVMGLIPGLADREITYKLERDPARYSGQGKWGVNEVGRLWWDLSTVYFLQTELDVLTADTNRAKREMEYRVANHGSLAPGSSVDIYEWTRSQISPLSVSGAVTDRYIETSEFDEKLGRVITVYYYWVRNPQTTPNVAGRNISATRVAAVISNIAEVDLPWVAPVAPNALLVGGVQQYLNQDTVLRLTLTDADHADGVVHEEWSLVSEGDERSKPPAPLWNAVRDSLAGFDDFRRPIPDSTLHQRSQIGLSRRPRQSLFAPRARDDARSAILAARQTYVRTVNSILKGMNLVADQTSATALLTTTSVPSRLLVWARPDNTTRIDYPHSSTYDIVVHSMEERDALLATPEFSAAIDAALNGNAVETPRILVISHTASIPSWSVWTLESHTNIARLIRGGKNHPDQLFTVASAYQHTSTSRANLTTMLGTVEIGQRVLVVSDEELDGFWSIWRCGTNGFSLEYAQPARLQDFWNYADWYADGYSADVKPSTSYATIAARNAANTPEPVVDFCRVMDDGTGSWIWTVFSDGVWSIVARQNGTIQLSDRFYDSSASEGYGIRHYADPEKRDGSFELRQIVDILRENILTPAQNVDVFFSMLRMVHAQQDHVGWAFKTSFLNVAGYNTRLRQEPVQSYDNTENLLEYIEEVKPYRVKTRSVTRSMTPDVDHGRFGGTDFDKPAYYDPTLRRHRRLDPNSVVDQAILAQKPWAFWSEQSGQPMDNSPIRRINTSVLFDRCSPTAQPQIGWDRESIEGDGFDKLTRVDTTAIDRMLDSYAPDETMRAINTLLGLDFKGVRISGIDLSDGKTADRDIDIVGYKNFEKTFDVAYASKLRDPHHAAGHPEEFVPTTIGDAITITVDGLWTNGAPQHRRTTGVFPEDNTAVVSFLGLPQSNDAISVYRDGVRADPNLDYTVVGFDKVEVTLDNGDDHYDSVVVQTFGTAGVAAPLEQRAYDANPSHRYPVNTPMVGFSGSIEVLVNGVRSDAFTMDGQDVALAATGAYERVLINVWPEDFNTVATTVRRSRLNYDGNTEWTLPHRTVLTDRPEYAGTICEVRGKRLRPPQTFYGIVDNQVRYLDLERTVDLDDLTVMANGVEITTFTMNGTKIMFQDPSTMGMVVASIRENHDYDVVDGQLTILKPLAVSDFGFAAWDSFDYGEATIEDDVRIEVTTFDNAELMDVRTYAFDGRNDGVYSINTPIPHPDHVVVYRNGKLLSPDVYSIDRADTDNQNRANLTVRGSFLGQRLVVMVYGGTPARGAMSWSAHSTRSGLSRMGQPSNRSGYRMNEGWEFINRHDACLGRLEADLGLDGDTIVLHLNPFGVASDLRCHDPLTAPNGVIWVRGERIEYSDYQRVGDTVTLSGLRRGTRGTHIAMEHRRVAMFIGNGTKRNFDVQFVDPSTIDVTLVRTDGTHEGMQLGVDYTLETVSTGTRVKLTRAPAQGTSLAVAENLGYWHRAGTLVHGGAPDNGASSPFHLRAIAEP